MFANPRSTGESISRSATTILLGALLIVFQGSASSTFGTLLIFPSWLEHSVDANPN